MQSPSCSLRPVDRADDLLAALVAISSALHLHANLFGRVRASLVPLPLSQGVGA